MGWFNVYGLIFVAVIMIPNIVFAAKCRDGFENKWKNKLVETLEQIGRFGCFIFMIINIPHTYLGFSGKEAFTLYLVANILLAAAYCGVWIVCFKKSSVFRALALSILPSVMFIVSAITCRSLLLTIAAVIFAPCHIAISYKNASAEG